MWTNLTTTRRLIGAVAALAAGTGFILREPIRDAPCNALSIFNLCDYTVDLERELDQVTEQETQQQTFPTVQEENNENLALFRDEIRLTQESVQKIKEDTYKHVSYMLERTYTLEIAFHCYQFESAYHHFLQSSQLFSDHKLAHYIHTSKPFWPHFTFIETISFPNIHLSLRDILLHNSCFPQNLLQLCKYWLLMNFEKVEN